MARNDAYIKMLVLSFWIMTIFSFTGDTQIIQGKDSLSGTFLIINSYNAQSIEARKNKKALFGELADSLKTILKFEFERKQNRQVIIVPGLINNPQEKDSVYIDLINKYSAS